MILFGAALEKKASDEQLRDALAIVFSVVHDAVKIIHSITEIKDDLITCCVYEQSEGAFSQYFEVYHVDPPSNLGISKIAISLAMVLATPLLIANDETANPYSFILVSPTGSMSVVNVDPDELDENERYIIVSG